MMSAKLSRSQVGFTLLELLLATALVALAITVSGAMLRGVWSARERNLQVSGRAELRDSVSAAIRNRLMAILPVAFKDQQGIARQFNGDGKRMIFVGSVRAYIESGGARRQTLQAVPDKSGGYILCLSSASLLDENSATDCIPNSQTIVAEDLKLVTFRYRGRDANGDVLDWIDTWDKPDALPEWIEVRVTTKVGDQWPSIIVHVPTASSNGL